MPAIRTISFMRELAKIIDDVPMGMLDVQLDSFPFVIASSEARDKFENVNWDDIRDIFIASSVPGFIPNLSKPITCLEGGQFGDCVPSSRFRQYGIGVFNGAMVGKYKTLGELRDMGKAIDVLSSTTPGYASAWYCANFEMSRTSNHRMHCSGDIIKPVSDEGFITAYEFKNHVAFSVNNIEFTNTDKPNYLAALGAKPVKKRNSNFILVTPIGVFSIGGYALLSGDACPNVVDIIIVRKGSWTLLN